MSSKYQDPWETDIGKKIWKTKSEYFVWLRGRLRSIWSDYPLRKEWKALMLIPISDEQRKSGKFHRQTKNVGQCAICGEWFPGSRLECDHIEESNGCFDYETAEQFLWHCARKLPSDFQLVCVPCHKLKSYCSKVNVDLETGKLLKQVIAMEKDKSLKQWLEDRGVKCKASERREKALEILKKEGTR